MRTNLIQKPTKPCTHLKIVHRRNDNDELDYIESELLNLQQKAEKRKEYAFDLHVSCLNTINEFVKKVLKNSDSSQAKDIIGILDNNVDLIIKLGDLTGYKSMFNQSFIKLQ